MVNEKDILTALQNGENPEVIAQNFADMLNAAIKQHGEAQAAAEKDKRKFELVSNIFDNFLVLAKEFYPEIYDDELAGADIHKLIEAMDAAYEDLLKTLPMIEQLNALLGERETKRIARPVVNKDKNQNDPIADFLFKHNL